MQSILFQAERTFDANKAQTKRNKQTKMEKNMSNNLLLLKSYRDTGEKATNSQQFRDSR